MKRKATIVVVLSLVSLVLALTFLPQLMGTKNVALAQFRIKYYGGPVMPGTMHVYAIYWFPNDTGSVNDSYISKINGYYQNVGGHRLYNMLSEYPGNNGNITSADFQASWKDVGTQYPVSKILSNQDIENEIRYAIETNNWPSSGYNNYFPVYTLSDAVDIGGACAYHANFGPQDNLIMYGAIFYYTSQAPHSCVVAPTCPNEPGPICNYSIDTAINNSAHEQFEAATNPAAYTSRAWAEGASEIGDLCHTDFGSTPYRYDSGQANQDWVDQQQQHHFYIIQTMASNSPAGCILGRA